MFGIDGCEEVKSSMFYGTSMQKARVSNERLGRRTESKWLADDSRLSVLRYTVFRKKILFCGFCAVKHARRFDEYEA